jgi:hypothetical protein
MELNRKGCKEMLVDFRKVKTIIPSIAIGGDIFTRVKSFTAGCLNRRRFKMEC